MDENTTFSGTLNHVSEVPRFMHIRRVDYDTQIAFMISVEAGRSPWTGMAMEMHEAVKLARHILRLANVNA